MNELRAEAAEHGILEPGHALIFRGLAADAQTQKLYPVLSQLLGTDISHVAAELEHPPLQLTTHADQQRLRKHQLGLANLGCITSLTPIWRYRNWVIKEDTKHRFDEISQDTEVALCLIRFTPAPGHAKLASLKVRDGIHVSALNHADMLLDVPAQRASDLSHEVKTLLRNAKREGIGGDGQTALALAPQDGELLSDLLDCLNDRINAPHHQTSGMLDFGAHCALAGSVWWNLAPPANLNQAPSDATLLGLWPDYELLPQTTDEEQLGKALSDWRKKQPQREQALERLKLHCERLDRIPSLPSTVIKIHQLAQSTEDNGSDIAALVNQDPSLSARILALVNSSWFGLRARVDSIEHALVVIGREELANMALMMSSEKVFRGLRGDSAKALWKHSSHVAEIARELAHRAQRPSPSNLFTAGLLHDVGRILMLSFEPDLMASLESRARQLKLPLYELERETWGHDHAAIGALMMAGWGLPDSLCQIVAHHHGCHTPAAPLSLDAAIIALADALAHRIEASDPTGDPLRLRQQQFSALKPYFGQLTTEALDLLAADMGENLRGPV